MATRDHTHTDKLQPIAINQPMPGTPPPEDCEWIRNAVSGRWHLFRKMTAEERLHLGRQPPPPEREPDPGIHRFIEEEEARPSSIIPVHHAAAPDPFHDLQLLRDLAIINGQTVKKLGPLPEGGIPVREKRRPRLRPSDAKPEEAFVNLQENQDMKMGQVAVAAAMATGVLAGCQPVQLPEYKHNPHPKEHYEITMTIVNAPGPLNAIDGGAIYEAPNCFYSIAPSMGAGLSNPNDERKIAFKRVSNNTWIGDFYADEMIDEDYGMSGGTCHWTLRNAGAALRATGSKGETVYGVTLDEEQIRAEQSETTYFSKATYPRVQTSLEDYPASGETDRSRFGQTITDDDLFTVVLKARRLP